MFLNQLSPACQELLQGISQAADRLGFSSYLVGGMVRDILLGQASDDIDIMVEGSAADFIAQLQQQWSQLIPQFSAPIKKIVYRRYNTGKLLFGSEILPGVEVIDFSSARSEVYQASGAVPQVTMATVAEDLKRRDFSVNALAVSLSSKNYGNIIDLFDGQQHLKQRKLVVLHQKSFEDDPARILRGLRLIARLGFDWEEQSKVLYQQACSGGYLQRIQPARLFDEFRKILAEDAAIRILKLLQNEKLLQTIHRELHISEQDFSLLETIRQEGFATTDGSKRWWKICKFLFRKLPDRELETLLSQHFRVAANDVAAIVAIRL